MSKFLFQTDDIKDTRIEKFVKMHCKGSSDGKEIYKPRSGKVNANADLYNDSHLKTFKIECKGLLKKLGYQHLVDHEVKAEDKIPDFIKERNEKVLQEMLKPDWMKEVKSSLVLNIQNE